MARCANDVRIYVFDAGFVDAIESGKVNMLCVPVADDTVSEYPPRHARNRESGCLISPRLAAR